eukprot:scaffold44692_cov72-Phaeocystis_antarctica.AAC.1
MRFSVISRSDIKPEDDVRRVSRVSLGVAARGGCRAVTSAWCVPTLSVENYRQCELRDLTGAQTRG